MVRVQKLNTWPLADMLEKQQQLFPDLLQSLFFQFSGFLSSIHLFPWQIYFVDVCVDMHICTYGSRRLISGVFLNAVPLHFQRQSLTKLESHSFGYIVWLLSCGIPLTSPLQRWAYRFMPPHLAFNMGAGIQTQVFMLAQSIVY